MTAIPDKTILSGSSTPTTSQFKNSMGQLWDYLNERNDVNATASGLKVSAAGKVLGRTTSGSGAIEEITYSSQGYQLLTGSTPLGKNKIINGKFDSVQNGVTSVPAITSGTYMADLWLWTQANTTAVLTASIQTDVPTTEFQRSLRFAVTTSDTSITSTDLAYVDARLEGINVRDLVGKTFTLSFWVRSSKIGTHCVFFGNSNGDRSWVSEYSINVANTWEYKTITVTSGLITTGTWDWSNGLGLQVGWTLASGTNYQTTQGAWQNGTYRSTSNQVNCLDTVGNIFAITGIQLEVGKVATPFDHRGIAIEIDLCKRYYRLQSIDVVSYGAEAGVTVLGSTSISTMRAAPTATQFINNLNFTQSNVTTTTSIYLTSTTHFSAYRLNTGSGMSQFSESVALSARL